MNIIPTATTYNFHGLSLRCLLIDGEAWFVAKDVCNAIGLTNTTIAVKTLSSTKVLRQKVSGMGGPHAILISESGLYLLTMRGKKAEAKAFQEWVARDVLPAIRRDGGYIDGEEKLATGELSGIDHATRTMEVAENKLTNAVFTDMNTAEQTLTVLEAVQAEIKRLTEEARQMKARAEAAEEIVSHHCKLSLSEFSREKIKAKLSSYNATKFRNRCKAICLDRGLELEQRPTVRHIDRERFEQKSFVFDRDVLTAAWDDLGLNQSHAA